MAIVAWAVGTMAVAGGLQCDGGNPKNVHVFNSSTYKCTSRQYK